VTDKYDVIVTVGFLMQDATLAAAKANPGIKFIGVDQGYADAPANLAGLVFEEDKSGFLAGALAAGMSKNHKIAAVLGTKSVPAVARFGEGYKAGAAYLDKTFPDLVAKSTTEAKQVYHADGDTAFSDPSWGAGQATSLIQAGYDVIFGAGGKTGNGAIEAAADAGNYVIGVDDDQYLTLATEDPKITAKILSSAQKLITPGVFNIIQTVSAGTFKSGSNIGPVALAPFHDLEATIPAPLKDALVKINSGLADGSIKTGVNIK
jgi:basic membrane protein A